MSIGLYDADMVNYKKTLFNLELMKLSAYYKRRNQIVALNKEFAPHLYTKTFIRKDYFCDEYLSLDKDLDITLGGHSITGPIYKPLDLEIEKTVPDTGIYKAFESQFINSEDKKIYRAMKVNPHLRLSLDGKTIWEDFEKQIAFNPTCRSIFIHDYDLISINGARDVIKEILNKMPKYPNGQSFGAKFPLVIDQSSILFHWTELKMKPGFDTIIFKNFINNDVLYEIIKRGQVPTVQYFFTKDRWRDENQFLVKVLPDILKQIIFCGCNGYKILLKYEQGFFSDYRWELVIDILNLFQNRTKRKVNGIENYDTVFNFSKKMLYETKKLKVRKVFSKEDIVDIFKFVQEESYELFKLFYECREVSFKGGEFVNDWTRN